MCMYDHLFFHVGAEHIEYMLDSFMHLSAVPVLNSNLELQGQVPASASLQT